MAKFTISVLQQYNSIDSSMDNQRFFDIVVDFDHDADSQIVVCDIDGEKNCYIKKSDLLGLASLIHGENNDNKRVNKIIAEVS